MSGVAVKLVRKLDFPKNQIMTMGGCAVLGEKENFQNRNIRLQLFIYFMG